MEEKALLMCEFVICWYLVSRVHVLLSQGFQVQQKFFIDYFFEAVWKWRIRSNLYMGKVRLSKWIVQPARLELECIATGDDFDFIPVAVELDEPV